MKRLIFLITAVLMIGVMACDSSKKWEQYKSDDGWFSAEFPGRPSIRQIPIATLAGSIKIHMFMTDERNGAYAVGYFDFPEVKTDVDLESPEFIESMANGSFKEMGGGSFTKKKIDFEGYPGMEVEGDIRKESTKGMARLRYYVVEKRIYILEVVGFDSFVNSGNTDRFLNSFRLIYRNE